MATVTVSEAVKKLIIGLASEHKTTQEGVVSALIYTIDGRRDHGTIKLNWKSIKEQFPAPRGSNNPEDDEQYYHLVETLAEYKKIKFGELRIKLGLEEVVLRRLIRLHMTMRGMSVVTKVLRFNSTDLALGNQFEVMKKSWRYRQNRMEEWALRLKAGG